MIMNNESSYSIDVAANRAEVAVWTLDVSFSWEIQTWNLESIKSIESSRPVPNTSIRQMDRYR